MRARRREINIFNMSLLDILCGALGAFCFMMLVALPYYKPPGTEKSLREAQAETQRLVKELENMKQRMKDPQSMAEMEDLLRRLETQIKALQGRVNILSSEKEQLTGQVKQLTGEVSQLTAQASQLAAQVSQLTGRVNQLTAENEQLNQTDKELKKRLAKMQERSPLLLLAYADGRQPLDLYLYSVDRFENRFSPTGDGRRTNPPFDPAKQWNGTYWPGDARLLAGKNGAAAWMMRDVPAGVVVKVYVKVRAEDVAAGPLSAGTTFVSGMVVGTGRTTMRLDDGSSVETAFNPITLPTVALTKARPWALVGTLTSPELGKIEFTGATDDEREAEWQTLSPPPTAAERAAADAARAKAKADQVKQQEVGQKVSKLMGLQTILITEKGEAEVLRLSEELLRELPPGDAMRSQVQSRRDRALEAKARREKMQPPAPAPSPKP